MRSRSWSLPLIAIASASIAGCATAVPAQIGPSEAAGPPAAETTDVKIQRALSAAPEHVGRRARIVDMDEKGTMTVLREGDNGFTCLPGHPGVVGDPPACMDAFGLRWFLDFLARKPRPTNTQPGIIYQLVPATDWSASDPWATSGTVQHWAPCWIITWPFDPKTTGLSDQPKSTGTWIMWAGTPYAHLMIHQTP